MTKIPTSTCAICAKPQVEKYSPFCSSRCASIDLNRWLGGQYSIPAVEEPDEWSEEELLEQQAAHDNDN